MKHFIDEFTLMKRMKIKDIMSKKRRIEDHETVNMTEECSAIIQCKLPQKLKSPRIFTIPCTIENIFFSKALCDLGASITLMTLLIFRKLGLGEFKPSTVTLQLADRSITYPKGIVEDVLVKIDKFIFLVDFVVLDMEEDEDVPLILGCLFLATGDALIDIKKVELTLRVNDEHVLFFVYKAVKLHDTNEHCSFLDVVKSCMHEYVDHTMSSDALEFGLVNSCSLSSSVLVLNDKDLYDYVCALDSVQKISQQSEIQEVAMKELMYH